MDAVRDHLIHTIVQGLMDARYAPLKRRRSPWHEGYDDDLQQARRVAVVIVDTLERAGYRVLPKPAASSHHTP